LRDIKDNEQKINFHGRRADSIVKGMLQHSRKGAGIKEPTDINALCDEYLRLAYHGYKAKDKTFNAEFETDFDPAVPLVNVVTQDFGRVILNIINNAFYALSSEALAKEDSSPSSEKKASSVSLPKEDVLSSEALAKEDKPKVTITTKYFGSNSAQKTYFTANSYIQINISDNGPGVPPHLKDKIFQPFFTTKPSGSGTGLGLSLAYEIVTNGHGGELILESEEGRGSTFIIRLPVEGNS
jgi:signal transduction histidine kinase